MRHLIKFQFYKYLESERGILEKQFIKGLCWVLFKLLGVPRSAWPVFVEEINASDFKTVIRRSQWLLSYSALKFEPVKDRYFDFSIGLSTDAARDFYSYMKLKNFDSEFDQEILLAQLASAVVESNLNPGDVLFPPLGEDQHCDELFVHHLNRALLMVDEVKKLSLPTGYKFPLESRATTENSSLEVKTDRKQILKRNRFRESALVVYFGLLDLLESVDIPVFAISGTMLGIIRENDFLKHDYDIDLGVFESDFDLVLLKKVIDESQDFFIKKCDYPAYRCESENGGVYARRRIPALVKIGHKKGIHTDLFVHIQEEDVCWHGSSLHGWINTPFELESVKFFDRDVLVPKNYDLYLTENYGDWRVPVSDFNCSTGTPNISITNSCKTLCYVTKLACDYFHKGLQAQAIQIESKMLESGQFDATVSIPLHYVATQATDSLSDQKFYV